ARYILRVVDKNLPRGWGNLGFFTQFLQILRAALFKTSVLVYNTANHAAWAGCAAAAEKVAAAAGRAGLSLRSQAPRCQTGCGPCRIRSRACAGFGVPHGRVRLAQRREALLWKSLSFAAGTRCPAKSRLA